MKWVKFQLYVLNLKIKIIKKSSDYKEKFIDTSLDYLSEDYKKNLTEICKITAPSKTYQAGGKNFVVIDRKVYQVTDEDYGLFTVNKK